MTGLPRKWLICQNDLIFVLQPGTMKEAKSRRKLLRISCVNCHATQDSLRYVCTQCEKPLYTNMASDEIEIVHSEVELLEECLHEIEQPAEKHANPYVPMDKAFKHYQAIRPFAYLPEMPGYLDRVLEVLIPLRIGVLRKTVRANLLLAIILFLFPIGSFALRMHWVLGVILLIPAMVWVFVTVRAMNDLKRAERHLAKISSE